MLEKNKNKHLTILGGGPAGLAAAYFADKRSIPFSLYESNSTVGGICRTIEHNSFFFDTGAHRFHDRNAAITDEILSLMGNDISRIHVPSQMRQETGDSLAALPARSEWPGALHQVSVLPLEGDERLLTRQRRAVALLQLWLVLPQVDV